MKRKPEATMGGTPPEMPATDAQLRLLAMSARTSTMIHELMQPLCAALNYLNVASKQIKGSNCSPEAIDSFERSHALVTRAVDIIRGMRAFALVGVVRGRRAPVSEILAAVQVQLKAENRTDYDLTVTLGPDAEHICVDPLQIELVLSNLIVNAIEAAPSGSKASVRITSRRLGEQVVLAVSDAGSGVTEAIRENLFAPLFTTKAGGSGLGLSICKVIIEAHGGQFWAAEPDPAGATFYMTLPAASAAE